MAITKDWNTDKVYGEIPFRKVMRIEFEVKGMKERNEAAWIQHELLLNDAVLRCHIEFSTGKGEAIYNPLDADAQKILALIKEPFKPKLISERELAYTELLAESYRLK